jgi:subtilisin family serine protease
VKRLPHLIVAMMLMAAIAPTTAQAKAIVPAHVAAKLAPGIRVSAETRPDQPIVVWVYFTDRAGKERSRGMREEGMRNLSARSLERRLRRGTVTGLLISDLPVHAPYVDALRARGARLRGASRWLNAASIEAPARLAVELAALPFVARIEFVPVGRKIDPVGVPEPVGGDPGAGPEARTPGVVIAAPGDTAYYGGSFRQLSMMQVPQLHAQGLTGAGVLVCMLDGGFRTTHQVFASLNVVARRDFVHGDTNVDDEPLQDPPGAYGHGTMTLACVAGSRPNTYSGGAFGASVALGKTEDVDGERPVEMDFWQFGAEWADSLGADIISSSLGYSEFDSGHASYSYANMDGNTTVVTRAAVEAVQRGITVVNSAGNSGASVWHYIIAPADADTLIAVGAVDSLNVLTGFSSRGPSSDGRIKPDVTGMGRAVLLPDPGTNTAYRRAGGTSFSGPLVAGVAALLLEAHPAWRPFEIREALRQTALNHASPNNDIGWGLVQGLAARNWIPSTTNVEPGPIARGALGVVAGPNPVRPGAGVTVRFAAPVGVTATLEVIDLAGRRRARLFEGAISEPRTLRWNGSSDDGAPLSPGVYWVRLAANGGPSGVTATSRAVRLVVLR